MCTKDYYYFYFYFVLMYLVNLRKKGCQLSKVDTLVDRALSKQIICNAIGVGSSATIQSGHVFWGRRDEAKQRLRNSRCTRV